MTSRISRLLIGLSLALAATGAAVRADAGTHFTTTESAIETNISSITLPSGPHSTLVLIPCPGCKPMSIMSTAETAYFLRTEPVTLAEFAAAIAGKNAYVSVFVSTKTNEVKRVVADLDAPPRSRTK